LRRGSFSSGKGYATVYTGQFQQSYRLALPEFASPPLQGAGFPTLLRSFTQAVSILSSCSGFLANDMIRCWKYTPTVMTGESDA